MKSGKLISEQYQIGNKIGSGAFGTSNYLSLIVQPDILEQAKSIQDMMSYPAKLLQSKLKQDHLYSLNYEMSTSLTRHLAIAGVSPTSNGLVWIPVIISWFSHCWDRLWRTFSLHRVAD
jgi:hypothetical protein